MAFLRALDLLLNFVRFTVALYPKRAGINGHTFGPEGPKSSKIDEIAPAPKRAVLGRPDELEGHVWRS